MFDLTKYKGKKKEKKVDQRELEHQNERYPGCWKTVFCSVEKAEKRFGVRSDTLPFPDSKCTWARRRASGKDSKYSVRGAIGVCTCIHK